MTAGPHNRGFANKMDPRVEGGRDGLNIMPSAADHGATNAGPHESNFANRMDPRIDGDMDRRGGMVLPGTHGPTNTGPHHSNIANKVDPRVDSDMDGRNGLGSAGHSYESVSTNATGTGPEYNARHGEGDYSGPRLPTKSALRDPATHHSQDLTPPTSPARHNFSYPSRTPPPGNYNSGSHSHNPQYVASTPTASTMNAPPNFNAPSGEEKIVVDDSTQPQNTDTQYGSQYGTPSAGNAGTGRMPAPSTRNPNNPGTLANLKAAAAGLHVRQVPLS